MHLSTVCNGLCSRYPLYFTVIKDTKRCHKFINPPFTFTSALPLLAPPLSKLSSPAQAVYMRVALNFFLILLTPSPMCWDYRHAPLSLVYLVLEISPKGLMRIRQAFSHNQQVHHQQIFLFNCPC